MKRERVITVNYGKSKERDIDGMIALLHFFFFLSYTDI